MFGCNRLISRIVRDESGATAIEYGLMAALISVAAITAMGSLGNALSNTFAAATVDMNQASTGQV